MRAPAIALFLLAAPAAAQDEAPARARHERGTIVVTDANRASASFQVFNNQIGLRGQSFVLAPTIDVFVRRGLTLGGAFAIDYEHFSFAHSFSIGGDGRLGLYRLLARHWALWPTLALGAYRYSSSFPDDESPRLSLRARLDLPILYYPAPGFFVGAGAFAGFVAVKGENDVEPSVTLGGVTMLGGAF